MKHLKTRILALGLALCLCLSLCAVPASAAVDKPHMPGYNAGGDPTMPQGGANVGVITLSLSLVKSGDNYTATYTASTTMVDWLATAADVCRADDRMANLHFTCTLTDALMTKLGSSVTLSDYNFRFTSAEYGGAEIFVQDSPAVTVEPSSGSLKLHYKLNPTVLNAWKELNTAGIVHDILAKEATGKMTMTATKTVPASTVDTVKSELETNGTEAKIEITGTKGYIPFYHGETVLAAKGECTPEFRTAGGGGGGGSVTPAKPTVEVKDNTPSAIDPTTGEPIPSDIPVGGGTTTVENPNAKPGEEVRIKTESDKGSMVNYITVKDENGNRIPVTYDGKGKFTFEMPESGNVTIEANYRVIPADPKETGVAELLNTDDHILYMIGDDKGDFRPNASISRAEVATAFFRLLRDQNVAVTQHFDDVSAKNWYVQPVETLASLHIIEGVGNGTFEPNRAITRAEFAAIAARFANALAAGTSFADVDEDAWYAVFVSTAARFGWINGVGNGMYEPDRPITRTEAAAIINRMLLRISDWIEVDAGAGRQFPDVGENFWGRYEISEAVNGHDHTLEEEYFHEDWLAVDWREAVDNDPVNFGQPKH